VGMFGMGQESVAPPGSAQFGVGTAAPLHSGTGQAGASLMQPPATPGAGAPGSMKNGLMPPVWGNMMPGMRMPMAAPPGGGMNGMFGQGQGSAGIAQGFQGGQGQLSAGSSMSAPQAPELGGGLSALSQLFGGQAHSGGALRM